MEAVTLRSSIIVAILTLLPLTLGSAGATTPLPPFGHGIEDQNIHHEKIEEKIFQKHEPFPERCTPRNEFCFGPIDPLVDIDFGRTGYRFWSNNTTLLLSHHPGRAHEYGPYKLKDGLIVDDLRICYETRCKIADPFSVAFEADLRVELWAVGQNVLTVDPGPVAINMSSPRVLPDKFGCERNANPC